MEVPKCNSLMDLAPLWLNVLCYPSQGPTSAYQLLQMYTRTLYAMIHFSSSPFISADSSEPDQNENGIMFYLQNRTEQKSQ